MRIVIATDFSPCSESAMRLGVALARRQHAALVLVHAVEPRAADVPLVPIGVTGWERDLAMAAEVRLAHDASEIRQSGLEVERRILVASAESAILEVATEQGAALIVVGTHGRKRNARLFLGSVAESVVRSATCPVLVVREGGTNSERWESGAPLRLTVGTDGSAASRAAVAWAGTFARSQPSALSIVRLYWPPEEAVRYGLDDPWDGSRRDVELLPLLERDLRRDTQADLAEKPEQLRLRAAGREAPDALAEEAASLGTDALVIGLPRRRSRRWTVLVPGPVLRSSAVPVFCVPEPKTSARKEPTPVRSVLVATDLSEASDQVVGPAYGILLAEGGRVELCTVHAIGVIDAIASLPPVSPLGEKRRAELESQLRALIPSEAEAAGIMTNVSVIEARFAAEAIVAAAERLDVDLIAVASRGRSGFKRAVLGSVAEEVARHSTRPVLIIRSQPPA
jgi:nucleotide-binding universal stress UspA family protein